MHGLCDSPVMHITVRLTAQEAGSALSFRKSPDSPPSAGTASAAPREQAHVARRQVLHAHHDGQVCRVEVAVPGRCAQHLGADRKSTRLNSSHLVISYAVFCLKKKIALSAAGLPSHD